MLEDLGIALAVAAGVFIFLQVIQAPARIASNKGRDYGNWLVFSLLAWPTALVCASLISDRSIARKRACPACADAMPRAASRCPACARVSVPWTYSDGFWWIKNPDTGEEFWYDEAGSRWVRHEPSEPPEGPRVPPAPREG